MELPEDGCGFYCAQPQRNPERELNEWKRTMYERTQRNPESRFKKRFVPFILEGSKTHTIRASRKNPPRVGETCHCYTGLRQKGATLLGRWPCVKIESIEIDCLPDIFLKYAGPVVRINGDALSPDECNALAWRDGFRNRGRDQAFSEMMEFWDGRLPFKGIVIHWRQWE